MKAEIELLHDRKSFLNVIKTEPNLLRYWDNRFLSQLLAKIIIEIKKPLISISYKKEIENLKADAKQVETFPTELCSPEIQNLYKTWENNTCLESESLDVIKIKWVKKIVQKHRQNQKYSYLFFTFFKDNNRSFNQISLDVFFEAIFKTLRAFITGVYIFTGFIKLYDFWAKFKIETDNLQSSLEISGISTSFNTNDSGTVDMETDKNFEDDSNSPKKSKLALTDSQIELISVYDLPNSFFETLMNKPFTFNRQTKCPMTSEGKLNEHYLTPVVGYLGSKIFNSSNDIELIKKVFSLTVENKKISKKISKYKRTAKYREHNLCFEKYLKSE